MGSSFADAFVKAGIASKEDAQKIEQQKKDELEKERKQIENAAKTIESEVRKQAFNEARRTFRPPGEPHIIEKDVRYTPFSKLWNEEKSHKFIVHLVHSYSPFNKGEYAWLRTQLHHNKCCICKCKLLTKEDFFSKMDQLAEISIETLKLQVQNKITVEEIQKKYSEVLGGRVLAVVSEESKAAFCGQCFNDFVEWVQYMLLSGHYEMNKIIRKQMMKYYQERATRRQEESLTADPADATATIDNIIK